MSVTVFDGEALAAAATEFDVFERAKKTRKIEESTPVSCIHVVLSSIAGTQFPNILVPVGASLGELRSQVAAMISLEPGQHFTLVWGERVLPETSTAGLVELGFVDGIVLMVVKKC